MGTEMLYKVQRLTAWCIAAVSCDLNRRMIASGGADVAPTVGADGKEKLCVILDERHTYDEQVFRAIQMSIRSARVQQQCRLVLPLLCSH